LGADAVALLTSAILLAMWYVSSAHSGETGLPTGNRTLVLESCRLLSIEEHHRGCDAEVKYRSLRVTAGRRHWGDSVTDVSGVRRVALYITGSGTGSEWCSKLDSVVLRDLTGAELRGALSIITGEGEADISIGLGRGSAGEIVLESVRVENSLSSLYTFRTKHHLSGERETDSATK
jgi:hypothetical protein